MTEKILYLTTFLYTDEEDPFLKLFDYMRDEVIFYVNVDDFNLDSEDALKEVNSWITEYPFGCGVLIIEAPAEFRTKIITMAESEGWKVVEFEIILRKIKNGNEKNG